MEREEGGDGNEKLIGRKKERLRCDSMGSIEMWKRKREELEKSREGEDEVFKRSRKTERSPLRETGKGENRREDGWEEVKRLRVLK